ncbi:MAG: type II toxin-antitoxin system ParD family antitoxin [Chloroflexales bacterium]|nr:type II toxin-antitoxin system ParD family antitoxin [Chloroflexales bacterium]
MSNININLTPYLKQYVESKVKGGRYNNVSDVVRKALRLLAEQDLLRAAKLRDLRAAIEEGDNSPAEPLEDDETLLRQTRAYRAAKGRTPS